MKLFTRYSIVNLLANIGIFLVASVAFYFSLRYVLIKLIDEDLKIEEDEITAYVQKHNRLPESFSFSDQVISFTKTAQPVNHFFHSVKMQEEDESNQEGFRRLTFGIRAANQWYQVDVSKSLEGTNNLLRSILIVSISTILLILFVSAIINRVLLKRLWRPFYQSINAIKNFRLSKGQPLSLSATNIEEFALLNQTLQRVTDNSKLEYLALKTFSENASHELQTPIAVIRSKLDLLIQDEQLTRSQSETLQGAYNALQKLSCLNQSLLLLIKIENNQFEEIKLLDLQQRIEEKLDDFHELWQAKAIAVQSSLEKATVQMNPELADVLLNNLLSNATNHNYNGGCITIKLGNRQLLVSNTSKEAALDERKLFHRFYKPSQGSAHNGLGLSIIRQICEASGFEIGYQYEGNLHCFKICFP